MEERLARAHRRTVRLFWMCTILTILSLSAIVMWVVA